MADGDPSIWEARVHAHGRLVAHLELNTRASAGISSARAKELVKHAAKALGRAIERERDDG